jgi:hypothetical protein
MRGLAGLEGNLNRLRKSSWTAVLYLHLPDAIAGTPNRSNIGPERDKLSRVGKACSGKVYVDAKESNKAL